MVLADKQSHDEQLHIVPDDNLVSFLLGESSLSEKEIDIICKRKIRGTLNGLTSNEISTYLYLKQHSCNGWYRGMRHSDLIEHLGISDRDIYHVLRSLEDARLIKVHGAQYSHYRDIRIYHTGVKKKTRFLSLNRTYFREGEEDYRKFLSLRAGTKSLLIYILFKEKLKYDAHENIIELNVKQIARYMGVKKTTVIEYIKELNETWPDFLIIQKSCYGTSMSEQLAAILDKRNRYGAISSKAEKRQLTLVQNNSPGFWRYFDNWLTTHHIKERCITFRHMYDPYTHGSDEERILMNRQRFFEIVYTAAINGVSAYDIYKVFYRAIQEHGFFDEDVTFYMTLLIPDTY